MSREGVESLYCHNHLISLVRLDRQGKLLTRTDVKHREIWEWRDHTHILSHLRYVFRPEDELGKSHNLLSINAFKVQGVDSEYKASGKA